MTREEEDEILEMPDPLGCPFCNRLPQWSQRPTAPDIAASDPEKQWIGFVYCHGGAHSAHTHIHAYGLNRNKARTNAMKAWNTRAPGT